MLSCALRPVTLAGICVFVFGNVLQHASHVHLARLREHGKKGGAVSDGASHYLPTWGPFAWVCCPHYTAEICIYLGLWLVCGVAAVTPLALALWTSANLCVTGTRTLAWYKATFGEQHTRSLKAVIPGIL